MFKPIHATPQNRLKLAFDWIPAGSQRLLDAGCAWGYGTHHYAAKTKDVCGCDPNTAFINQARNDYPAIKFENCPIENTPYENESFDVITLTDVLEHVDDELSALNELCRVMKPGGLLIITTPHKGLFSFMDTDNYAWHLRTKFPRLYRWIFRMKHGKDPLAKVGYESPHRHYNLDDFVNLLDRSAFNGCYEIQRVFRGGLIIGALGANIYELLSIFTSVQIVDKLIKPIGKLSDLDFFINYGKLSWNIGILIKKR
jgi:ubiquinone/menaquinone biosynthesis C-methylase UbiE